MKTPKDSPARKAGASDAFQSRIQSGSLYTRQQVMQALNLGRKAWTSAVRKGLPIHKHGTQYFVLGDELIRFISSLDRNGVPVTAA